MAITERQIEAAATAIATARSARNGVPPVKNVLELLRTLPKLNPLYNEVMEDARLALEAAAGVK